MKKININLNTYSDALTTAQAEEILGVGKTKFFELLKSGAFYSLMIGRKRLIPKSEIVRYLKENGYEL